MTVKLMIVLLSMTLFTSLVTAAEYVELKSGKKVFGKIKKSDGLVHVKGSRGIISFSEKEVIVKETKPGTKIISEIPYEKMNEVPTLESSFYVLTFRSGRTMSGLFTEKEGEIYAKAFGGMIRIESSQIIKKEKKLKAIKESILVSGERSILTLQSGRLVSGILNIKKENFEVISKVGVIEIPKSKVVRIKQTGFLIHLNEDKDLKKKVVKEINVFEVKEGSEDGVYIPPFEELLRSKKPHHYK